MSYRSKYVYVSLAALTCIYSMYSTIHNYSSRWDYPQDYSRELTSLISIVTCDHTQVLGMSLLYTHSTTVTFTCRILLLQYNIIYKQVGISLGLQQHDMYINNVLFYHDKKQKFVQPSQCVYYTTHTPFTIHVHILRTQQYLVFPNYSCFNHRNKQYQIIVGSTITQDIRLIAHMYIHIMRGEPL